MAVTSVQGCRLSAMCDLAQRYMANEGHTALGRTLYSANLGSLTVRPTCAGQGSAAGGGDLGAGVPAVGGVRSGGETHGR